MGYTHYWNIKGGLMHGTAEQMLANVQKVVEAHRSIIQLDYDVAKPPRVNPKSICFNGIEENGHEVFFVRLFGGDFCKTARKPYDLPVCKVLLILKAHFGNHMDLSSDGFSGLDSPNDYDGCWEQAIKEVREMGYTITYRAKLRKDSQYVDYDASIEAFPVDALPIVNEVKPNFENPKFTKWIVDILKGRIYEQGVKNMLDNYSKYNHDRAKDNLKHITFGEYLYSNWEMRNDR